MPDLTIDCTPTWEGIAPLYLEFVQTGNATQRDIARSELMKMAKAADKWNAHCKQMKANSTPS